MTHSSNRSMTRLQQAWQQMTPAMLLSLTLTLVPLLVLVAFIFIYSHNLLDGDDLRMLPVVESVSIGEPIWRHLFVIYAGHIHVPTQLEFALLARFFNLNIKLGLWINLVVNIGIFVLLLLLTKRRDIVFAAPLLSVLFFSVTQDLQWVNAYTGHWAFTALFVVLSIWLVQLQKPVAFWFSLLTGVLATYSMGNGFLVWVAVLPAVWAYHRGHRLKLALWAVTAILSTGLYFFLLFSSPSDSAYGPPVRIVLFWLTALGSPFLSRLNAGTYLNLFWAARLIGLVGLAVFTVNAVVVWRKVKSFPLSEWLGLAVFALLSLGAIATTRSGIAQWESRAFLSWYQVLSLMFWCIVVVMGYIAFREAPSYKGLHLVNSSLLTVLLFLFVLQNARIAETGYLTDRPDNPWGQPDTEQCAEETIYRLSDCSETPDVMLFQASYGYGVFHRLESRSEIGSPDVPVIVDVAYEWQAVALRDWILADAALSDVVVEQTTDQLLSPNPVAPTAFPETLPESFWYACTPDQCNQFDDHAAIETVNISEFFLLQRLEVTTKIGF